MTLEELEKLAYDIANRFQGSPAAILADECLKLIHLYRTFIADTCEGMQCTEKCDSVRHDEFCPVANAAVAWRQLRTENETLRRERDCLHVDDVIALLKEKGLDKRPEGK